MQTHTYINKEISKENTTKNCAHKKIVITNKNIKNKKNIIIYTDGCSLGNPGPGGYGIIIIEGKIEKEISGGFKCTTNNRMELMACIIALTELKNKKNIIIYSDSKYTINSIKKGWVIKWKKNNWKKHNKEKIKNIDLWIKLLNLYKKRQIDFNWIQGHTTNIKNERCDTLAKEAALFYKKKLNRNLI